MWAWQHNPITYLKLIPPQTWESVSIERRQRSRYKESLLKHDRKSILILLQTNTASGRYWRGWLRQHSKMKFTANLGSHERYCLRTHEPAFHLSTDQITSLLNYTKRCDDFFSLTFPNLYKWDLHLSFHSLFFLFISCSFSLLVPFILEYTPTHGNCVFQPLPL